jgi:hypothetical protein
VAVVVAVLVLDQGGSKQQVVPPLPTETRTAIKLGWDAKATFAGHEGLRMRFRVASVAVGRRTWVVHATVTNTSKGPLKILTTRSQSPTDAGPSLLVPQLDRASGYASFRVVPATRVDPPLPETLAPGESWTGTFGGLARIPRQTLIYVGIGQFQLFTNADESPIAWNSTDSFRLQ